MLSQESLLALRGGAGSESGGGLIGCCRVSGRSLESRGLECRKSEGNTSQPCARASHPPHSLTCPREVPARFRATFILKERNQNAQLPRVLSRRAPKPVAIRGGQKNGRPLHRNGRRPVPGCA